MSKSKKNVIDPEPIVDQYGADAVRWFMLSDSPPERDLPWSEAGIEGSWRLVQRIWRIAQMCDDAASGEAGQDKDLLRTLHKAIAGVTEDIEALAFNKAVARIFTLATAIEKSKPSPDRNAAIRVLLLLVAPMTPHLAEEAWMAIGTGGLIANAPWPVADQTWLIDDEVTIAIQVKGKLRDTITIAKGLAKEDTEALALASDKVQRFIDGATIRKVIVVPDRLVNIVI